MKESVPFLFSYSRVVRHPLQNSAKKEVRWGKKKIPAD
ncbi:hypothetical protein BTH41_03603 [Bacillus mycoides]|nr:hypothetical protein BTH41_03603 [Bacillus mycoides]